MTRNPTKSQLGFDLLRYRVRRAMAANRATHRLSVMARPHQWAITVRSGIDVVIEGFPRSGNNFAYEAFQRSNPTAAIASRTHAPAAVQRAAGRRLPTILLIRDPRDAVRSLVVRQPYLGVAEAVNDWLAYYTAMLPVRAAVVVADFRDVTEQYGSVIDRVNRKFGTGFERYENTAEADAEVLRKIESHHRDYFDGRVLETHVGRPSEARDAMKAALDDALDDDVVEPLLRSAGDLYERLSAPP